MSFVFQDTFLFNDTIYANITAGNTQASLSDVIQAAQAAQCDDFIRSLPKGYDTIVGERGVFLSGGEAQRICIARAILRNSPILVLDEATAFADPENEYKIQQALQKLIKGKTVIIIAHRLSSITSAHQILVFKEGCLVQKGRHDESRVFLFGFRSRWSLHPSVFQCSGADGSAPQAGQHRNDLLLPGHDLGQEGAVLLLAVNVKGLANGVLIPHIEQLRTVQQYVGDHQQHCVHLLLLTDGLHGL